VRVSDLLQSLRRKLGTNAPYRVVSGYRSPRPNRCFCAGQERRRSQRRACTCRHWPSTVPARSRPAHRAQGRKILETRWRRQLSEVRLLSIVDVARSGTGSLACSLVSQRNRTALWMLHGQGNQGTLTHQLHCRWYQPIPISDRVNRHEPSRAGRVSVSEVTTT